MSSLLTCVSVMMTEMSCLRRISMACITLRRRAMHTVHVVEHARD